MTSCAEAAGGLVTQWFPLVLVGLVGLFVLVVMAWTLLSVMADVWSLLLEWQRTHWWRAHERRTSLRWWDRRR